MCVYARFGVAALAAYAGSRDALYPRSQAAALAVYAHTEHRRPVRIRREGAALLSGFRVRPCSPVPSGRHDLGDRGRIAPQAG